MTPKPFFLTGTAGDIFCLYFPANQPRGAFVYCPPLAEEMNRCRATVAQQARQLAALGYACLLMDPFGTGESAGELSNATWEIWQADVLLAAHWLTEQTQTPISLWGLRLGALLTASVVNQHPQQFEQLLWWQPVLDGKLFLTQYLRLRVAFLMHRDLPSETTDQMRTQLAAGATLEVAGYLLGGALAQALDCTNLRECTQLTSLPMTWLEHVSDTDRPVAPASLKVIAQLRDQRCTVTPIAFTGPPIWQLHKRDEVPQLLALTTQQFNC
ncbi:hydrolase 2, exosortase A system-associated [Rhodoferax sp. 4810]|uniref:Hydrolase 2, exosortase A system-associated n=1 Tax=Thiospirillum jenense TaxID=1653858 RepID=A0A839HD89_9GAMM|nr:hydrolase 2, exosortase A system-associated [Thiospirillum jenense]MBB1075840.1 hydrolase 2, exosortase A system-associated [Rhodoferax jenense]MBB1126915.1 hydrolase 2, exosortase A system-associated [Thiospirillum jenense]